MLKNVSFVILVVILLLAILMEPLVLGRIGGISSVMIAVVICLLVASYKKDDIPFFKAVTYGFQANKGLLFFFVAFYFWVTVGYFRNIESVYLSEVKIHLTGIFALFLGLFLSVNKKYTRILILVVIPLMLFHAFAAKKFVDETGNDLRSALKDPSIALGHTNYWTAFVMLSLILTGYLFDEKNKIIKIIGVLCLIPLYYAILICGFATPVALFIIGHLLLGFAYFRFGKKRNALVLKRLVLFVGLVILCTGVVLMLSQAKSSSLASIQSRFQMFLEDPRGGGYERNRSRFDLIFISMDTFKENPILGCGGGYLNNPKTGGHQAMFDYLALYGIVGGGAMIIFVCLCLLNAVQRCKQEKNWASYGRFAVAGMFMVVGIVNPLWLGPAVVPFFLLAQPFKLPKQRFVLNQPKSRTYGYAIKQQRLHPYEPPPVAHRTFEAWRSP